VSSALTEIQQAIYSRLTGDATLMGKITGVFDQVPENQPFPYVTIGEYTSVPFRTMTRFGEEVTVTLHIWSQYNGFKEALDILDDMNRLLADKEDITVTGYDLVACFYEFSETLRDPDGMTRHVPVRYRFIVQKQG
jgi:hypothetical protein